MSRILLVTAFLMALLAASAPGAIAQEPADPNDRSLTPSQRLAALVERVRLAQAGVETLEADFEQRKNSELLIEPSVARGVFSYAAPDRVRWEYVTPDPISLLIDKSEMTTWYRDIGQAEKVHVGDQQQKLFDYLGANSSMERLMQYFSVSLHFAKNGEPYQLELKPLFKKVEKRVREMSVWIDVETYLPVGLRYVEGNGDLTQYEFRNMYVNRGLPQDRFDLEIPVEVDVRNIEIGERAGLR